MRVVQVRDEAALHALKPAWGTLVDAAGAANTFQTWEWASAWWSAYGKAGELRILAAFDEDSVLRGIAPLRSEAAHRYGQTVPVLSFVGDGSNDSDYLDFIIAAGHEVPVMQAFNEHLSQELRRGTVLRLNEIPEHSPTLPLLGGLAGADKLIRQEEDVPCGAVPLPGAWEDYLAMLRPRFRSKIRSTLRNLESRPEVRFGVCRTPEQLELLLPALFDLHTRRWAQDGKPGVFGWDQKLKFYGALSPLLLERGWLRFTWLQWNERILACQYGFAYNRTYFQLQEGYEPEAEHWNVGIGLRAWSIREFMQEGLREYDFLGGLGRQKADWGATLKHSKQILLARPSIRNVVFCRGREWETRARESLRRITPERFLAARQAYLERRSRPVSGQDGNGHAGAPREESWTRKAAARFYIESPLPALMRPLRDRRRFFISHKRKWPGISWGPRAEGTGRILYFHRVNEECDPFFPASSPDLFEQQMRFVSRHLQRDTAVRTAGPPRAGRSLGKHGGHHLR